MGTAADQVIEIGRTGTMDTETIMLGPNDVLYGIDRDHFVRLDTNTGAAYRVGGPIGWIHGYDGDVQVKDKACRSLSSARLLRVKVWVFKTPML